MTHNIVVAILLILLAFIIILCLIIKFSTSNNTRERTLFDAIERALDCTELCEELSTRDTCGSDGKSCCVCESAKCRAMEPYKSGVCNPSLELCREIHKDNCRAVDSEAIDELLATAVRLVGRVYNGTISGVNNSSFVTAITNAQFPSVMVPGRYSLKLRVEVNRKAKGTNVGTWVWKLSSPEGGMSDRFPQPNAEVYTSSSTFDMDTWAYTTIEYNFKVTSANPKWDIQVKQIGYPNNDLVSGYRYRAELFRYPE